MNALETETEAVGTERTSPPDEDLHAEIASLDLPERVKERLRKLIAAGPPSDGILKGVWRDLSGKDEALAAGMCWYLGAARLSIEQMKRAAALLNRTLARWAPPTARPGWALSVCWGLTGLWAILFLPRLRWMFAGYYAATLAFTWLGARARKRRLQRPSVLDTPAAIEAVRALGRLDPSTELRNLVGVIARSPPRIRPAARRELAGWADDLGNPNRRCMPMVPSDLPDLIADDDPATAAAALNIVGRIGEGWLVGPVLARAQAGRQSGWSTEQRAAFCSGLEETLARLEERREEQRRSIRREYEAVGDPTRPATETCDDAAQMAGTIRGLRLVRRALRLASAALYGVVFAVVAVMVGWRGDPPYWSSWLLPVMMTGAIGGPVALLAAMLAGVRRRNDVLRFTDRLDPRTTGLLVEATRLVLPDVTAGAEATLTRALPQVRACHRSFFTPHQRQCLLDLLVGPSAASTRRAGGPIRRRLDALLAPLRAISSPVGRALSSTETDERLALQVAILQALMHIGDAGDLAAVRLTERRTRGKARFAVVHAAAAECLAILEERARLDGDTDRLVRPADAPDEAMLLRPATGAPTDDEATLVRPGAVTGQWLRRLCDVGVCHWRYDDGIDGP